MSEMPLSSSEGTNSYVFDPEAAPEMARLINLDRLTTQGMGGLFANLPDPGVWRDILDVACGPGGWVLDVAHSLPEADVTGIDISQNMVRYAIARVRSQGLTNASFDIMDITKSLDFADASFDFINARFLIGVLRRGDWSVVLAECKRILRPGGILRLTDMDMQGETNSLAYESLARLACQAMKQAGYGFSVDGRTLGITHMLTPLLRAAGFHQVQLRANSVDFSAGTEAWADLFHSAETTTKQITPLIVKMGLASEQELQQLALQQLIDMQENTFCGIWHYTSAWGVKPEIE
jgi:ubiquinone/menaquinone biosynthesis C-methylase UbiE